MCPLVTLRDREERYRLRASGQKGRRITQAALGRGRENLPPSRPKGPEIRRPFLLRRPGHNEPFPRHRTLLMS